MLSVLRPPCDADVIRAGRETPGCASHAKPWVLAASILGSSVVFLEASVVNVALPAIQEGLHASVGQMQWISSTMTLFLATLTLVAGSAGDRFGRRRLFTIGLGVIAVGSLVAGFAVSSAQLIIARALQGLGGALLVPNSLALLSAAFPRAERGRAIGTWSAFTALTNASGPILGGVLVDFLSWRAGFLMVVPLALGTMVMAATRVSDVRIGQRRTEIDWRGAIVATAGLTLLVFGVIKGGSAAGWLSLGAGLGLLATFAWLESRASSPMMPPRLFRSRTFLGVNLLTLLLYFAVTGVFFVLPFDLVRARGYSATATGASFLPFALIVAGLSRWTGGLVDRFGARLPLVVGPLLIAAGLLLFAVPMGESYWASVLVPMAVAGLGMAVTVAPLTTTVMAAVDESEVGVASGVNNTIARVAALLAIAIFGLVALQVYASNLAQNLARIELSPALRSAVASQAGGLGDVTIPESASDAERKEIQQATAAALSASFRWAALLAAVLAAAGGLCAGVLVDPASASLAADPAAHASCSHQPLIQDVSPRGEGCPDCLRIGSDWVHLRMCLTCGYVGCCDASRNHHATSHFWATGHPIVCSLEPGETWRWCYLDDVVV